MHFSTLISGLFCASVAFAAPTGLLSEDGKSSGSVPSGTCPNTGISPTYKKKVVNQFATDQIVPDLIERINPTVKVNAVYDTPTVGNKAVQLGTYFTIAETLEEPTLSFSAEKKYDPFNTKYSYFLVDPDVPQDGSMVQVNFLHWAVSHAQPSCVADQSPVTTVIYEPLTPLSTTQHRYTFLVYREPEGYEPNDVLLQIRTPFDLNDYVQTKGLVLVGGNFLKESAVNGIQSGTAAPLPASGV